MSSPKKPAKNSCVPITIEIKPTKNKGRPEMSLSNTNLPMAKETQMAAPIKKTMVPQKPNICMGFLPYLPTNIIEARSKNPFTNLSQPNLLTPYFRAWCATGFSVIFLKPAHLAKTGI